MTKKNLLLKLLLVLAFFISLSTYSRCFASDYIFNGETIPSTSSIDDDFYGVETVTNILDDLGISYNDITKVSYTYYVNQAYKKFKEMDNTTKVINICFYKYAKGFYMIAGNGSFSDTLPYIVIDRYPEVTDYNPLYFFNSWKTDSNGNINGVNYTNSKVYHIYTDSISLNTSNNIISPSKNNKQTSSNIIYWENFLTPLETFAYAGYTELTGWSWYLNSHNIRFSKESTPPSGGETSGDNSGDQGGGTGGSSNVDLTMTNEKIDQLNKHAEEIKNKIPTSGDIATATTQGNKDYWGKEEDLNGEKQEEEIQGAINEIMDTMSGEISKNEIFSTLSQAEDGFLNFFREKHEEQWYDLAFSWEDILYENVVLIPKGGINISELCRNIPELKTLQGLIRTIFNFSVCVALVKQVYNLVLATLGIDNPYLYENGTDVTTINEDTGEYKKTYVKKKRVL